MAMSFKEFYETRYVSSKRKLLAACDDSPRMRNEYKLTKYCKFPVFESMERDEKVYVSFKPMDKIQVLWEQVMEGSEYPVPKCIYLVSEDNKEVYPCWTTTKFNRWIEKNTIEA